MCVCVCVVQEDNGMPVHLKGGSADALLYRMTMVLTVMGENDADAADSHPRCCFGPPSLFFLFCLSRDLRLISVLN